MKFCTILSALFRSKMTLSRSCHILKTASKVNFPLIGRKIVVHTVSNDKFLHTDSDNDELYENFSIVENKIDHHKHARSIILPNDRDGILVSLSSCVSVEEVLNLVQKYINMYNDLHVTQTILVLRDLQELFYQYNGFSKVSTKMFLESLRQNEGFCSLLQYIKDKIFNFNPDYLSYVIFHLNRLGISIEDELLQTMALQVRDNLINQFVLDQCARFLSVIFSESSIRPYYLSLHIIPLVINHIEKCSSVNDLHNLTICLNKLHNVITSETLEKYKTKVEEFLEAKKLAATDYPTLLKIILLLNYPEGRDKNISLISKCILLLKNEINVMSIEDLTILYEVFFKNQEPGSVLNNIQRCSAKFFHQLDETEETGNITRLKLFSSVIYFSSPIHRIQFRKHLRKYLKNCSNYREFAQLRKIFSYVKVSDREMCADYWNLSFKILNDEVVDPNIVVKMCQNYLHFNTDIDNYRHYKFEISIMDYIRKCLSTDPFLNPWKISGYLSFAMLYGNNADILKTLLDKFEENLSRVKASDILKVSHSLSLLNSRKSSYMSQEQIRRTKKLLNKCTKDLIKLDKDYVETSMLLKAYILRSDNDNQILEDLVTKYDKINFMSSKIMENISYIYLGTRSLIPEVINKCTEYVIKQENNILAFNAEKLLSLCYYLDYHPINGDKFFEVVINLIIRDQERLSGLAFLQSALSLCYFNKLPSFFVKQIFNVEFLEKLDLELENCYSKDKYPQRVRKVLMMLNRAVCLEYPEYNVPWFHKKYFEDIQKHSAKGTANKYQQMIKEYLIQATGSQNYIEQNVAAPYGYHIDFVINLNNKGEAVPSDSPDVTRRVALLLFPQHAFTRFYVHLRGECQLNIRHLEIFGYEVGVINLNEWMNLFYGEERLEYISKLI